MCSAPCLKYNCTSYVILQQKLGLEMLGVLAVYIDMCGKKVDKATELKAPVGS